MNKEKIQEKILINCTRKVTKMKMGEILVMIKNLTQ
jgi:hypothetical protein